MDLKRTAIGAVAGAAATVPMTAWMLGGQALTRHGELAPKRLVRRSARRAGLRARRGGPGTALATTAAHLGFGAACGALYGAVVLRSSPARGAGFGIGVWAASYTGWIPALGLLPPPHRDHPGRALTMLTAHLIYGAGLGAATAAYDRSPAAGHAHGGDFSSP
ncbi:MAG: putative rane protein [Micromonosporaceae bacterium]